MKLTDKAKRDFLNWVYCNESVDYNPDDEQKISNIWINHQDKRLIQMIIIEWFESLEISSIGGHNVSYFIYSELQTNNFSDSLDKVIEKLNKNYNETN